MTAVLTALGARWDGRVVAQLEGCPGISIARRCADLPDLVATAASGVGDVALVAADLRGLTLSEIARLNDSGVDVIGVVEPGDEAGERRLWQLGVATVLSADSDGQILAGAVLAVSDARAPSRGVEPLMAGNDEPSTPEPPLPLLSARGRIIAVWGPSGAPGRTSLAVNIAAELAVLGREVLLVDADTYGGCVAQTLSVLDEAPGVAAAARAADQGALDLPSLARLAPVVSPRLRVLTGIPVASRWPEIRGAALQRVLDISRWLAEVVVVDIGFSLEDDEELSYDTQAPRRNQATLAVLESADDLVVVGGCDPVSLQRLVRALQEIGSVRAPHARVVVNRVRPGPVGSPAHEQVADALLRFAGVTSPLFVPYDPASFDVAMLQGRTLAECAPHSSARQSIARIAADLIGLSAAPGGEVPVRGWRRRRPGR
ncbi:MAG: hypothetical protein KBF43_02290 [Dermatophilaceae bacterium]|jgi:MinD-like ATPase involved in chromosome partitioning or flagellar assembly|nr:chromosome partitioning protein [Actinomycetales bacterium]MBP8879898.1 hypothetical protein [Dermatophilaceae bacterium]MBP9917399.1 hypothetical protein [Dermatophilaceae bacterium]